MPDVGAVGRGLFVVAKLDQLGRVLAFVRRERMHGEFVEAAAEIHQVVGRDVLVAEDDQLVLDQRGLDRLELFVRQLAAKIDAADLGAEMDADLGHGDAGALGGKRFALVEFERLVHGASPLALYLVRLCRDDA